ITLKSMNFQPVLPMGTSADSSMFKGMELDLMSIIQTAVLAIVALVLGLFVVRPLLAGGGSRELNELGDAPMLPDLGGDDDFPAMAPMMGDMGGDMGMPMAIGDMGGEVGGLPDLGGGLPALGGDGGSMSQSDAADRLRGLINDRKDETVEILRNWLDDREEA
ncbi:MAG: flagellar M-ring protein FliF, partial [Pseudomonadota bacterium]|nr:flagellar M-ring protein FliF [Pseudomonadota bacterium]